MHNPESQPHSFAYSQLAYDYDLSPDEVEHAARAFGNDFASLELALSNMEPLTTEDFSYD